MSRRLSVSLVPSHPAWLYLCHLPVHEAARTMWAGAVLSTQPIKAQLECSQHYQGYCLETNDCQGKEWSQRQGKLSILSSLETRNVGSTQPTAQPRGSRDAVAAHWLYLNCHPFIGEWPHGRLIIIWRLDFSGCLILTTSSCIYSMARSWLKLFPGSHSQACSTAPVVSVTLLLTPWAGVCPIGYRPNDCSYFHPPLSMSSRFKVHSL